ncbi:uncharacterized protein [Aegilops tauschii subsp. strangulata]|uniref:uncharacterized protein n=1 Tax=Aegilops tauschii subsp. strangulata TaxID=200361 RepID=UPI003CC89C03
MADPVRRARLAARVATGHRSSHRLVQENRHRRPHPFRASNRAELPCALANECISVAYRRHPTPFSVAPVHLRPPRRLRWNHYPETVGETQYDYGVDDPSLPEQPDVGAQEPDATADACYYVETADDQV